ncbi:hypothetical protein QEG60_003408 [Pluralibacter gergoviae]|uniref:hypothetical protein n=1 Tax=Pluralibacter gergoviae TaxID=61647 RepID=UPI000A36E107|nr:hypothetical protein [Pluralibacter gergoviae]EKV3544689.1 hypothetical protein [Pluralibacter gergoviae]EKV9900316.1 hypothetical protein [Pluralibacter gergoviae]EKV9930847.1 hypothetical protein [Pluralibacter gergoviae]HDS1080596.1 hypothetical protein [Pluralibacter gergoviae]
MITKNFRLNALANQYAAALYNHITATSGGEFFTVDAAGVTVHVKIIRGIKGVRQLIDATYLQVARDSGPGWERIAIHGLSKCVNDSGLTDEGRNLWQGMVNDMGAAVANHGGGFHA